MRRFVLLGLVAALVLGVVLTFGSSGTVPPQQWAQYYEIGHRRPEITRQDLPYLAFIPDFGSKTIQVIAANLPITSEEQLRSISGLTSKKVNILLALYNLSGAPQTESSQTAPSEARHLLEAQVTRVVDGDTIDVKLADGSEERVRYIGMDTPEIHGRVECYGQEASAYNERLVGGRTVWLELDVQERDQYGRLLAYVYLDSDGQAMVNAILLSQGYAQIMTVPPNVKCADRFLRLQQEAREAKRGLWGACP